MSTLLQEILTEQEVLKMPPGDISKVHKGPCSCLQCTHGANNPAHKNWRQRRNARYFTPTEDCGSAEQKEFEEEQFLGSVLGTAVKIGSGLANAASKVSGVASKLSSVAGKIPKSPIISIGNRQRAALLQHWGNKLNRAKSPVVQARYQKYIDTINKRQRPSWHQSEKDLQLFFKQLGMPEQKTFLGNQPAKWIKRADGRHVPPRGSVIPDINPADAMVEVKNYNIQNQDALIRNLQQQIGRRMQQGPQDAAGSPLDQKVILDMRGQQATLDQLKQLAQRVSSGTGLAPENIQVVTWEITL
jgi:peptidoglycan hydrolase-like protein with peptidoglycan-binding domain